MALILSKINENNVFNRKFNPYESTIYEIERDIYHLDKIYDIYLEKLRETLFCNHISDKIDPNVIGPIYFTVVENYKNIRILPVDEKSVDNHLNKIINGLYDSSPFDKKILNIENIYSIDEIKLEDFRQEYIFRECLEYYYYILRIFYDIKNDYDAIVKKIEEKLLDSLTSIDFIFNSLYEGDETILSQRDKIRYLVTNFYPIYIEFAIEERILINYYLKESFDEKKFTKEEFEDIFRFISDSPIHSILLLNQLCDVYDNSLSLIVENLLKKYSFNNLKEYLIKMEQLALDYKVKKNNIIHIEDKKIVEGIIDLDWED